ncbi:MAG: DNA replication and repair protein RecF [Candidatus Peregrinibacteria bacterium]
MRLTRLSLTQWRSYKDLDLPFGEGDVHLLLGPNGSGKTNVLEAVSLLSSAHSFLSVTEYDLMHWGTEYYRILGEAQLDAGMAKTLEVVSQELPRKARVFFLDDVRIPQQRFVGALPAVTFLPQDLELFVGSPARRRDVLNDLLVQVSPAFAVSLTTYQKVLRQRNTLLRKIVDGLGRPQDLQVWDEALACEGAVITLRHLEILQMLQCTLGEELQALGESWNDAVLCYERKGEELTQAGIEQELLGLLLHYRERDLLLCQTTVGPHRHDWRMDIDGRSLPTFASRGQQRTAVLALLFLQVSYIDLQRGEKPIILLDDVFSELDEEHQERLLDSLSGHQVLLTATHLPRRVPRGAEVYEVSMGKVNGNTLAIGD